MSLLLDAPSAAAWLHTRGAIHLVSDSRKIIPSSLEGSKKTAFIAWPGATVDSRTFVPQVLANGAVAALLESQAAPPALLDITSAKGYLGLKADSGLIASLFYGEPSKQLQVIAFTGTNGKTTSSWWLAQALSALPAPYTQRCAVVGTLGTGCMGSIEKIALTTPDAVQLQAHLKSFVDQGCKTVALEASSIGLVEGRLNGTAIHTAVFTNFTQDHLDYHGSMEAYWQAKAALFDSPELKNAVVNIDDAQGLALVDRLAGKPIDVWTLGIAREARLCARKINMSAQGVAFEVVEKISPSVWESYPLQTPFIGHYNVCNLLGVLATMRSLHIPLAICIKACSALTALSGRLEIVSESHQPLTVIDYAHTPDALENLLITLREVSNARGGKLWCVFGCAGNRDATKRPVMGAIAKRFADQVVITSDNPRDEKPNAIVAQILLGTGEGVSAQVQVDRAHAISETIAKAGANDVVVVAGKGHEDYQEVAGIKTLFSDQVHARAALALWSPR